MHIALPDDVNGLCLVFVEEFEEQLFIGEFEGIGRLLVFVLMKDIAIGIVLCPLDVIDIFNALNIHCETFETVRDFRSDGADVLTAYLLEVGELRDLHTVEPDFPTESPGAKSRRFPIIFDKADVRFFRIDAETFQALKIEFLDVVR